MIIIFILLMNQLSPNVKDTNCKISKNNSYTGNYFPFHNRSLGIMTFILTSFHSVIPRLLNDEAIYKTFSSRRKIKRSEVSPKLIFLAPESWLSAVASRFGFLKGKKFDCILFLLASSKRNPLIAYCGNKLCWK